MKRTLYYLKVAGLLLALFVLVGIGSIFFGLYQRHHTASFTLAFADDSNGRYFNADEITSRLDLNACQVLVQQEITADSIRGLCSQGADLLVVALTEENCAHAVAFAEAAKTYGTTIVYVGIEPDDAAFAYDNSWYIGCSTQLLSEQLAQAAAEDLESGVLNDSNQNGWYENLLVYESDSQWENAVLDRFKTECERLGLSLSSPDGNGTEQDSNADEHYELCLLLNGNSYSETDHPALYTIAVARDDDQVAEYQQQGVTRIVRFDHEQANSLIRQLLQNALESQPLLYQVSAPIDSHQIQLPYCITEG